MVLYHDFSLATNYNTQVTMTTYSAVSVVILLGAASSSVAIAVGVRVEEGARETHGISGIVFAHHLMRTQHC